MRKLLKFTLIFLFGCQIIHAQQRAQFTQYMNNNYILNPAAGGTEDFLDIKAAFRNQWIYLPGSPTTYYLSAHTPIGKFTGKPQALKNRYRNFHVMGGYAYNDITGPTKRGGVSLSYSYNLALTRNLRMSTGVFAGFQQYTLDGNMLDFHDQGDEVGVIRIMVPDATIGTWLYNDRFFAGIAVSQLLRNKLDFKLEDGLNSVHGRLSNHYFITTGFKVPISEDVFLVPSLMLKVVTPVPPSIDLNLKVKYQNLIWAGVSYRHTDSFSILMGYTINDLVDLGYSFDYTVSALNKFNSGTHEILVGVRLKRKVKVQCPANFW